MSIDRRIVSILYHNDIFDIEDVEKFVGEKDNYYEIIIGGELKKLKIPGNKYEDEIKAKIKGQREKIAETLSSIVEDDKPYFSKEWVKEKILGIEPEPESESEISFEEEMKKSDDESTAFLDKIKEMEVQDKEEEDLLKYFNEQLSKPSKIPESKKEEIKEVVKETKKNVVTKDVTKPTVKKTKKVDSKKPDDDIDDFLNAI